MAPYSEAGPEPQLSAVICACPGYADRQRYLASIDGPHERTLGLVSRQLSFALSVPAFLPLLWG